MRERVVLGALIAATVALTAAGCRMSYVFRSAEQWPLRGASSARLDIEAHCAPDIAVVCPRLETLSQPLRARMAWERPSLRFVEPGESAALVIRVVLHASLPFVPGTPYEVTSGTLQIDTELELLRGTERVALVRGRADGRIVTFHELLDPNLEPSIDRTARRLVRMFDDLGLEGRRPR